MLGTARHFPPRTVQRIIDEPTGYDLFTFLAAGLFSLVVPLPVVASVEGLPALPPGSSPGTSTPLSLPLLRPAVLLRLHRARHCGQLALQGRARGETTIGRGVRIYENDWHRSATQTGTVGLWFYILISG